MKNVKNTMVCWNPKTDEVALIPWPDSHGLGDKYRMSALACYSHVQEMSSFIERKAMAFIEAMHLIIRDGCAPMAVHNAMLGLEEYRDGCADDMPGVHRSKRE
jgi:hypothetical protein